MANGGNLRALLLKENKLKHLAVHLEDFPGAIPLENLKQLETLTINFSVKEASSVDDFLDEFEKRWLGPIVFPYAIKIELMVDARKNALEYTEDHSVFAMAAQKGITLELTQRVSSFSFEFNALLTNLRRIKFSEYSD